ncbi:MAG: hydroxyacid dehydrogenase [Pseudomonadota bacterium]|nr:hydroxyacid dehydrogenase [Pseudomonadota bacterium]
MARVVVVGKLHENGMKLLQNRRGLEIEQHLAPGEPQMREAAARADAILIRTTKLSGQAIAGAKSLRVVARHGVGYDNIDIAALNVRKIPLALVGNVNATSVAEHTMFLLLAAMKQGVAYDRATREGRWSVRDSLVAADLAGKNLLIVGLGRIGREVATRAAAFGMKIVAYDPVLAAIPEGIEAKLASDLDRAVRDADAISLHSPLSRQTRNLFSRERLALMKPSAILVCAARGGLIDEVALAEALGAGRIRGAGLDVFAEEPPSPGHPLLALDNVVLSPHSAALTEECAERMATISAQNCLDGLDGRLNRDLLANPEVLGGNS